MNKRNANSQKVSKNILPLPPIAVIGLSGIMPEAENLDQYWENIINEVNCITEVPPSRWNIEDYYDPDPSVPDKTYSKYGGFIPDIQFDPMEFGLPPNLLEVTDVSQLLSLIVAKNALIDAGYFASDENILNRTGVILGMVGMSSKVIHPLLNRLQYPVWEKVLRSSSIPESEIPATIEKMKLAYVEWNENAFPGAIGNVVAGRIANRLDLGGTNCIVDAACASSLGALSMAVSELALGRAEMMITGGVDTDNSILTYMCFSKTPAFSKGGNLHAFSEESDGMLAGEGIGMLVLKRLEDAERDNDRIYSVIRGIGSSSDGHFKSIYAPRSSGQAKAIRRAYEQASYPLSTVRLIEAHGTGTNAGDPAEFGGLVEAFGAEAPSEQIIALGSVKSQIGHTKATAGAASLIKASLALHQKILPVTINVSRPHPAMEIETTPFYLNTETRPWFKEPNDTPRRAGVSSFGFGGTNFHIALEEYQSQKGGIKRRNQPSYSILLSAETPEKLLDKCLETQKVLDNDNVRQALIELDQNTNNNNIPTDYARVGFVAETVGDASEKLNKCIEMLKSNSGKEKWTHPIGIFYRLKGMETDGKTVALFPGQGSQYLNMGRDLAINFPSFRETIEKGDKIFSSDHGGKALSRIVFPIPVFNDDERKNQSKELTKTENAQPAIGLLSVALYNLLQAAGFEADFYAGHSFGELTALWASGVFDQDTFIRLAIARGAAMGSPASTGEDPGTMIAVKGDIEKLQSILAEQSEVVIANYNSSTQVVLAGSTDGVKTIKKKIESLGFSVYPLHVSAAFHTSFVSHAQTPFKEAIKKESFSTPTKAVYSNSTAAKHAQDPQAISSNLAEHILNPVQFKEEIESIYKDGGSIFIEIGPRNVLTNLVKDILRDQQFESITLNPNPKGDSDLQFRQSVLEMRVLGFELKDIDPYMVHQSPPENNHSKVAVTLNGGLYMTQKSKDAFNQAVSNKTSVNRGNITENQMENSSTVENTQRFKTDSSHQPINLSKKIMNNEALSKNKTGMQMQTYQQLSDSYLANFLEHQNGVLKAHELFLQNDTIAKILIQEITSAEIKILSSLNGKSLTPDEERLISLLAQRLEFVNNQQIGTSKAHAEFIRSQSEYSKQYALLAKSMTGQESLGIINPSNEGAESDLETQTVDDQEYEVNPTPEGSPVVDPEKTTPSPSLSAATYDSVQLSQSFLQIVSDKTGYPTDMLELNMDMEADLGIDSIKRVEILGAMQEEFPQLPTIPADDLVNLRTLEQIINAFGNETASSSLIAPDSDSVVVIAQPVPVPVEGSPHNSNPDTDLQSAFLEIVSEKTGYPSDMLETSMDMEADLGIDSIKRVEILGAMQEQFPHLPTIEAEELSVLRTLKQIIDTFNNSVTSTQDEIREDHPRENQEAVQQPTSIVERHAVEVQPLPKPDFLKFEIPDDSLMLISDDGSEKSSKLADYFKNKNNNVGMLHFSSISNDDGAHADNGITHYFIQDSDEDQIQEIMKKIIDNHGKISAFIHLNPASISTNDNLLDISDSNANILKSVFLVARHLGKPLEEASKSGRSAFITVTQMNGQLGLNGSKSNDPLPGGFSGLTKSLRQEWTNVFCRAVDVHPDLEADELVKIIDAELHDADLHLTEIGYTSEGRYTLSLD